MWEADQLAENVSRCLSPLIDNVHELAKSGDLNSGGRRMDRASGA